MLQEIDLCVTRGDSFAFETTLSGLSYLRHIDDWKTRGYQIALFFLALPSADMAVARVAERVRQGGHHVPEDVIRRRFAAGRQNFEHFYRHRVHSWALYDSSTDEPALIEWGEQT